MPSMDDFLAPAANDEVKGVVAPTEVENLGAIEVTQEKLLENGKKIPVVKAANTQDAINKAVENNVKFRKSVTVIQVGTGKGVVASGVANYEEYENRNASLISKRQAYVKAFMTAKKNLTEHMHGLTSDAMQGFVESLDSYDTGDQEGLANTSAVMLETNEQKIEGMIRGYVVYSVSDDPEEKMVTIHIVSTPKTRGETLRASTGTLFATDFQSGMQQVFAELKTGVLPPVGSRVITVPSDQGNELFFISFGSAVNKINKNPTVERKLRMQAQQIARQRAAASMVALIRGEESAWKGGFTSATEEANRQFDEQIIGEDTDSAESTIVEMDETMSTFTNRITSTDAYRFAQKGSLPPGLQPISWNSEDGDWSYAAYVYNPSLTASAEKARDAMMKNPSILERGNTINQSGGSTGGREPSVSADREEYGQDRPIQKGPSGSSTSDDDL